MTTNDKTQPAIIRLPFARPIGQPEEQLFNNLIACGKQCDLVRNIALRTWQRWREDNPDWQPDAKVDKDGNEKLRKSGAVIRANLPAPNVDDVTFTTYMYRCCRERVPEVSSTLVSMLSREVWSKLKQKAKWVPGNTALYEWEAILNYEIAAPSYRSRVIPVPNQGLEVGWDDCCWVSFPLWSKKYDGTASCKVECKVEKLPPGLKRLVQLGISGEIKISDSSILKRKRFWELHLVLRVPCESSNCDAAKVLVLEASDESGQRPFVAILPDGSTIPIGAGVPLMREYERLVLRRKSIRASARIGAMKGGHGARRIMRAVTSESRRYGGVQSAFHRTLADDVYRLCVRNDCGTVDYFEPKVRERSKTWFASNDTPFDWTQQLSRLVGKLKRRGIELNVIPGFKTAAKVSE